MTNLELKNKYMNRNVKTYPFYHAFTWDMFFIWTISMLFYTQVKGMTYSQAIMLDSIIFIFAFLISVPLTKIFAKTKPLTASRISNFGYMLFLIFIIVGKSYYMFVFAQFFYAFAISLKGIKEPQILSGTLNHIGKSKDFNKLFGKGTSMYYAIDAIAAIVATYMYSYNPYLALYTALAIIGFAQIYSFVIKEPFKFQERNTELDANIKTEDSSVQKQQKPDSFRKILFSGFVLSLIFFSFAFRGVMASHGAAFKVYLQNMTDNSIIPIWAFGYFFAAGKLFTAISSKFQFKYDLKFGVRSVIIFTVLAISTYLLNGIVYLISPTSVVSIVLIVISSVIQFGLRPPISIFITNYAQVCTPKRNIEKVYAIRNMADYLGFALINISFGAILSGFGNNYGLTNVVFIAIYALPFIAAMLFFVRQLVKKYAQKYTLIKSEYVDD